MSKLTTDYINKKILENQSYIRITYYELRVKYNFSEKEVDDFIVENRPYLEDKGYNVYLTGSRFNYQNADRVVESNEIMIAIKDNKI